MKKDEKEVVEEKAQEANEGVGEKLDPKNIKVEESDGTQIIGLESDEEEK